MTPDLTTATAARSAPELGAGPHPLPPGTAPSARGGRDSAPSAAEPWTDSSPGRAAGASSSPREDLGPDVAAALAGSVAAFERLYRALAGPVAGYLRWHGIADVEGLTNEVMAQVHRNLDRFEGDGERFRSWVFTIAHHRMVDDRRRAARRPVTVAGEPPDTSAVGDAEQDALGLLGDDRVEELLSVLSADQRDVLLLRVVADLSIDDVAGLLGKRPGAIKALQHRALAALRRHLEREHE